MRPARNNGSRQFVRGETNIVRLPGGSKGKFKLPERTTEEFCVVTCDLNCYRPRVLSEKPWKVEAILRLFLGVFLCMFVGMTLLLVARKVFAFGEEHFIWRAIVAALSFHGVALVMIVFFVREHGMTWSEAFGLNHERNRALLLGVLVAVLFLPLAWGLQWLAGQFMSRLDLELVEQQAIQALRDSASWRGTAVLGLIAIVLAPVAEEILFRGILYPAIKRAGFPRTALWGTSILFAVIHGNLLTLLPLLVLAIALTLLYEATDNLLAPIATHAAFNAVNLIMLGLSEWANQMPVPT